MNFFRNLKLANKLLVSFVLILLISAVSGLYGLVQMERVNATATDLARQWLPAARNLQDMRYQLQRYRSQTMQHVMAQSSEEMAVYDKSMPKLWDELVQNQQSYAKYVKTDKERALLAEIGEELKAYAVQTAKVVDLSHQLLNDEASEILRGESLKISRGISTRLDALSEINHQATEETNQAGDDLYAAARWWVMALLLGSIVIGVALAVLIARSISRPLQSAVQLAQSVAAGDLSASITVQSQDEVGQLLQALKDMNTSLQRIVGQVRQGTDSIASASSQIASGNQDLSSRTEEQASSLEQTAASMDEIVMSVRRVTDIMGEISVASHQQTSGIEQVTQAVTQMDQMTQQNAALVEEAAAATDALRSQAAALAETVSFFKLGAQSGLQATPALAPAALKSAPARAAIKAAAPLKAPSAALKRPAMSVGSKPPVLSPAKSAAAPQPQKAATADDGEWESF
ncbi:methyl-accepting chemotaxis protein [Comamonas thiooxydans]|uniref:methyl-accepting chemotaxis protein n=3 Tax=Comamonas thiooxydans TaxID=363952 RepID=UPI00265DCCFD|nr:MCP four helix bundle domain-containing protein [Comamonas thiooxydans]